MLAELESRRFVGREAELARLAPLLRPEPEIRVAYIHGPGGIGKSSLLRELGRRAAARGLATVRVDGRDSDVAPGQLATALERMREDGLSLLLLDTYEQVSALGALLRRDLPPLLAQGARIAIAGRRPPEPAWLEGGWQEVLLSLRLSPLSDHDSRNLLRARGLADAGAIGRIVAWGEGSPLALSVAGDTLLAGNRLRLDQLDAEELLAETIVSRLAGAELDGADRDVVAVAAIARAVDAPLLAATLPGVDGDHAESWLRGLSFSEPLGTRVTLHERVRRAVRTALSTQDREHYRALRRRIADHLYGRAVLGELRLLADLSELLDNPALRWGIAPPPVDVRADRPLAGDLERLAEILGAGGKSWWSGVERWFEAAPEHVIVIRDAAGDLVGWRIWVTPASAPAWVDEDAVLGPWLADARRRCPDGDALLLRDGSDLVRRRDEAPTSPVVSAANYASVLGSGLRSVRHMYATTDPEDRQVHEFLLALGYERKPELDIADGERQVRSYVVDWGPGGIVRAIRDLVYHDLGIPPPAAAPEELAASMVRDALRSFHDPIALAAIPLGRGADAARRAAAAQALLREAVESAFGNSADQRLLRRVVERGYLDADGGHTRAMQELSISRTTYFRRLSEASDRVAQQILSDRR